MGFMLCELNIVLTLARRAYICGFTRAFKVIDMIAINPINALLFTRRVIREMSHFKSTGFRVM